MSFTEGDLLYVSDRGPNDDWLPATCGGRKGLVPANYGGHPRCFCLVLMLHFHTALFSTNQ